MQMIEPFEFVVQEYARLRSLQRELDAPYAHLVDGNVPHLEKRVSERDVAMMYREIGPAGRAQCPASDAVEN